MEKGFKIIREMELSFIRSSIADLKKRIRNLELLLVEEKL
jgi:hypothetical protein